MEEYDDGNESVGGSLDEKWLDGEENGGDESNGGERMVVNPTYVRERIDHALSILSDFKSRVNKSKSRSEILEELSRDLSEYYGYLMDLSEMFLEIFSPAECVEFMDAGDKARPLVIRTNTLKTTRKDLMDALSKRGVSVEAVEWSKVAIKVTESSVPIGATPEYLAGHYMLQSAASLNPVMALDPQPGERILDMSAAPGGKSSFIAQLMKNSGTVIANDLKRERQKATIANLHRMGVKNTIVCCYDGRQVPNIMKGFDRVLLDAPCSGLGVISRDQSVKLQRTLKDIQRNGHLQKELLCAAVDAVDPKSPSGGVVVYSTCSVSTEENEQVVEYMLQKRHVRLVETGLEVGKPGFTRYKERRFHPSMSLTRRFYPHVHNMDGFFVAKFQKYANGPRHDVVEDMNKEEDEEEEHRGGDKKADGRSERSKTSSNEDNKAKAGRQRTLLVSDRVEEEGSAGSTSVRKQQVKKVVAAEEETRFASKPPLDRKGSKGKKQREEEVVAETTVAMEMDEPLLRHVNKKKKAPVEAASTSVTIPQVEQSLGPSSSHSSRLKQPKRSIKALREAMRKAKE